MISKEKKPILFGNPKFKMSRVVIGAFVVICLIMSILCYQYYFQLQKTITEESSGYLQEISKHISKNASKTFNDNFAVLGTISTVLKNTNVTTYKELNPIIQEQKSYWHYQSILLVDDRGIAYNALGQAQSLNNDEYLRDVVVSGKRSMSASQMMGGTECIMFAIPIQGVVIEGVEMRALIATYNLSTFDQILAISAFDEQSFANIIRKDGTVAIRSKTENNLIAGYNVLNAIGDAEFEKGNNITKIRNDIEMGVGGQAVFTLDGIKEYMIYTPLDMEGWTLLTFVPVSFVNAKSQLLMKITLLLCGVITLTFAVLIGFLLFSFYRHKNKLEQMAYVDAVTGGATIQLFYKQAGTILASSNGVYYALIYTNIEKFKLLNEQFGNNTCDKMLRAIEHGISSNLSPKETMGRIAADNFCVLVKYTNKIDLFKRFDGWYEAAKESITAKNEVWLLPIIEMGVYQITDDSVPFPQMIDRAKLALRETNHELRGRLRCAVYDDEVRKVLFREKHLEDIMEDAMAAGEFRVYLQPKYFTANEKVGGAEALVRWQSKTDGMIYPDEFINLFEKNGFIIKLDLWVFEQVCRSVRAWLDAGIQPVKVSVNCSRVHLKNPNFLGYYQEIAKRYQVPMGYLEIELTENVVFEDVEHLSRIIDDIHRAGFGCSMDDFGCGYSSLNVIQNIPVDTIKLDKIFFRTQHANPKRSEAVIASIITMSKALSMVTVAEGVEERPQVDMLKRLGCDYIQGFYFAKPMPIDDFEMLTYGRIVQPLEPIIAT